MSDSILTLKFNVMIFEFAEKPATYTAPMNDAVPREQKRRLINND